MLTQIFIVFWAHFIGDFLLQSTFMSMNKSKDPWVLALHCTFYALPFLYFGLEYAVMAGVLHYPIDFFTSKATSYLYKKKEYHWFFVVIGFDQAVHMTILVWSLKYLGLI